MTNEKDQYLEETKEEIVPDPTDPGLEFLNEIDDGDDLGLDNDSLDEDGEDEELTLSKETMDELRGELDSIPTTPIVKNGKVTSPIFDEEKVDKHLVDILSADQELFDGVILPNLKVDHAIKQLSKLLLEARGRGDRKEVEKLSRVLNGINNTADGTGVDETLCNNEEVVLQQGFEYQGSLLSMRDVDIKPKNKELRGQAAILKITSSLSIGGVVHVPLPHSGFWVSISPPSERALNRFYSLLARAKNELGRSTLGFIFNNDSVVVNNEIFGLIKEHILDTSFKDVAVTDIDDKILLNDLPILIQGFAATIYPGGFLFRRMCDNTTFSEAGEITTGTCGNIVDTQADLKKMFHMDSNRLNDTQKEIFSRNRNKSINLTDYENYIKQAQWLNPGVFEFGAIKVHLKQPTLREHFEDGLTWIEDITEQIDYLVASSNSNEARQDTIDRVTNSTALRKWAHYVDYIEVEDKVIRDRETIRTVVATMGSNDDFTVKFVEEVIKYRNKSIIAVIGIDEYICPNCGHLNEGIGQEGIGELTNIIPINPTNLFFIMFITKYQKDTREKVS